MYNTILVPLDGSNRSETILPHVESLAQHYTAKVVLVMVNEVLLRGAIGDGFNEIAFQEIYEETERKSKAYIEGITRIFHEKDIPCEYRLGYGAVVDSILQIANEVKADLVAMASHGKTGLARVFYGSVASGILNRIDRPLFVIRAISP